MKKYLLALLVMISINVFVFSQEEMENWTSSNIAVQIPMALAFSDNLYYMYYSIGVGMRIKTFADLYIHPCISYAIIHDTHIVTYESVYIGSREIKEIEDLSRVAFRIALEYTVYKYSALRNIGPYRYLTSLNPLVRVYGDLGPIIGLTFADGIIVDAGINWREHHFTSAYSIQYNFEKRVIGFFMSVGYAF